MMFLMRLYFWIQPNKNRERPQLVRCHVHSRFFYFVKLLNLPALILNAAFSLSGAFVFGGQLGFIAGVNPGSITWFVVVKLVAGIAGLLIANMCEKRNLA